MIKNFIKQLKEWKSYFPYPVIIALFVVITIAYVSPILEGKKIIQPDIVKFEGMAREVKDFRKASGSEALWTNSMFGGMPAYQISVEYPKNISTYLHKIMTLCLPRPADMIFLYFVGFFIFLLLIKINPWVSFLGALAFALSSYNFIIIDAGHNSKAVAIAYMAPVLGSIIYTFRGKYLVGGLLFAVFLSLQIFANHFQITYYLLIIVVLYGLFELIENIKKKSLDVFMKALGVLTLAAIIALGVNISRIWSTYEYSKATMRGGTELEGRTDQQSGGLEIDYITAWSYGIGETFSLMIPNVKGGATKAIGDNKTALNNVDPRVKSDIAKNNQYWGDQPFTSGPVYVGAIIVLLFILSLFYVKGTLKYALLTATILSIMLAWGKNFMPLTEFFVNYIPGYNKFRAVSMTLTIAAFCIPALAVLGLSKILEKPEILHLRNKYLYFSFGITGGLALLFYLFPGFFFSFFSQQDNASIAAQKASMPDLVERISWYYSNLEIARISIFKADAFRSFIFITLAASFLLASSIKKLSFKWVVMGLSVLIIADMWSINRRYLNDDNFETKRIFFRPFTKTAADEYILQDKTPGIRVLDLTESTFNSSRASYFHNSVGGYHGAKLQRYQDIIDNYLSKYIREIAESNTIEDIRAVLEKASALNMLNTRYIIYNPWTIPIININALGNAWFVKDFVVAENADEELSLIGKLNLEHNAVIEKQYANALDNLVLDFDTTATISLKHYQPNKLIYESHSETTSLVVFSEIYYPKGWNVYINNKPAEHFRANYILRAMVVPEGENEIKFEFKPGSYYIGTKIELAFSVVFVLLLLAIVGYEENKRNRNNKNPDAPSE